MEQKNIKIPQYAKQEAKRALKFNDNVPKSQRVGLTKQEANKLGINSGIERAKQLINNKTLSVEDAKRVLAFYNRFKNCRTTRCEVAISLWGGRRFGKELNSKLNKKI